MFKEEWIDYALEKKELNSLTNNLLYKKTIRIANAMIMVFCFN